MHFEVSTHFIMAVKEDFREVEALRHKLRQTLKTTDWKLQVWNLTKLGYTDMEYVRVCHA